MSRLNAVLSRLNQSIGISQTREDLFDKVSQALIEQGGFPMSWVGWYIPEENALFPTNKPGTNIPNRGLKIVVNDPQIRSGMSMAFHSGQPYISNDVLNDPNIKYWWPEYEKRGYKSSVSKVSPF